ncbi:MAG: hypothetical protein ACIAZJ_09915 [Gimesia chilikensis]|uniref:hypothetical protein n=1 Tax=Gimesia chilikensis TaxID=2605989 RepID=UPI0037A0A053
MKPIDYYPALINWIWVIPASLLGTNLQIGGAPLGPLWLLLIIGSEWYRVSRIVKHLEPGVTVDQIRRYFSRDAAHKWIHWKDQARGINAEAASARPA